MRICLALIALILTASLQGCARDASGPVIVMEKSGDRPYPTARIQGSLLLEDGCLMIDQAVVFWPPETSWSAENDEVVFGAVSKDLANASVDSTFTGGGGIFVGNDAAEVLNDDALAALNVCLDRSDASYAVLAYPD